jgi:hypothetical protein
MQVREEVHSLVIEDWYPPRSIAMLDTKAEFDKADAQKQEEMKQLRELPQALFDLPRCEVRSSSIPHPCCNLHV